MFETVKQNDVRNTGRYALSLLLSMAVHAAVLGLAIVLPLVFFNALHAEELIAILIQPPPDLPEPPIAPMPPLRTAAASGIAVVSGPIDPVPRFLPRGIPAPDEAAEPAEVFSLIRGIGPPSRDEAVGEGIRGYLNPRQVVELPKPKPPVPRTPIRVGGDVQESRILRRVAPVYPELAVRAHVSGSVILEAEIDEEGNVRGLKVLSGHPLLVKAAKDAVKQWKYSPTLLNGEPQTVLANVTVIFRLR